MLHHPPPSCKWICEGKKPLEKSVYTIDRRVQLHSDGCRQCIISDDNWTASFGEARSNKIGKDSVSSLVDNHV